MVNREVATYSEIRQFWDINDVMRANEWLDIRDDYEHLEHEEQRRRSNAGRRR